MARVLLTWELGGGLGHLMNLRPLAVALAARGHRVFLAAGDLSRVPGVFAGSSGQWSVVGDQLAPGSARGSEAPSPRPSPTGRGSEGEITVLAAPWKTARTKTVETIVTYADLLLNIGFGDGDSFTVHQQAWRNLYDLVKPDVLICDHSPSALLAARGQSFAVATVGTGFFTPVDESPLRLLRKVLPEELPAVRAREQRLLEIMNAHCRSQESGGRGQESGVSRPKFIVHRSSFIV
jgi:hypothetical protein